MIFNTLKEKLIRIDVCLDLLAGRAPHQHAAMLLFSLAEQKKLSVVVSSLSFANMDYILRSTYGNFSSREKLTLFKTLVEVAPVSEATTDLAIASSFTDFEAAIQYTCALQQNIEYLITRNLKDYKKAGIPVMTAETFLSLREQR
ncbi:MAG: PIN domain-containing protein [Sphingomonadales bacterium]